MTNADGPQYDKPRAPRAFRIDDPAVAEAHMYDTLSSFERLFFHVATA